MLLGNTILVSHSLLILLACVSQEFVVGLDQILNVNKGAALWPPTYAVLMKQWKSS